MIAMRGYVSGRHGIVLAENWTPTLFLPWKMQSTPGWWLVLRHSKMKLYKRFSALHALKDLDVTMAYRGGVEKGAMVVDVAMPIYQGTFISLVCYGREGFTAVVKSVEKKGKYHVLSIVGLRDWTKELKITKQELAGKVVSGATDEVDVKFEGTVSFKKVLDIIGLDGVVKNEAGDDIPTDISYNVGEDVTAADCFDVISLFAGQSRENYSLMDKNKINIHTWWWAGDGRVKIAPSQHKKAVGDRNCVITDCKFEEKGFYNSLLLEHEHEELSGAGEKEKVIVRGTQYYRNELSIAVFGKHQKKISLRVKITKEWEAIADDIIAKTSIPPFVVRMQNLELDDFSPLHMTISGVRDYKRFVVSVPVLDANNNFGKAVALTELHKNFIVNPVTRKKSVTFQTPPIYGEAIFWFTGNSGAQIYAIEFKDGSYYRYGNIYTIEQPPGAQLYSLRAEIHQMKPLTWRINYDDVDEKKQEKQLELQLVELPYKRCTMPSLVTEGYVKNAMMAEDVKINLAPHPGGMKLTASELTARTSKIDDIERYLRRAVVLGAGII